MIMAVIRPEHLEDDLQPEARRKRLADLLDKERPGTIEVLGGP